MFGGVFSNTWAKQQQAEKEANSLMNGKKNALEYAEENSWYKFMKKTIELDGDKHPHGWHWFWGLHYLYNVTQKDSLFDIPTIQDNLPDRHWLKKVDDAELNEINNTDNYPELFTAMYTLMRSIKVADVIDFSKLKFNNTCYFSNLVFPIDTDFKNTEFSKDVFFNNAVFCETADFEDAIFQNEDSYRKETAKFRNTIFKKIANFRNATFWGYANFKGAKLEGRAFFQKAKFEWHAPRFYDATFNNEMTWAGITLPKFAEAKVDRYKKVDDEFKLDECDECAKCTECAERAKCVKHVKCDKCNELIEQNRTRRIEENQNSYENTAILLAGKNKYHDQHFFFREEMRCRRELEDDPFIGLAYKLYENFADYGYGIDRAFKAWVRHIVYGFVAILIMASISIIIQSWYGHWQGVINLADTFFCSAVVSATNATPYVFIGADDGFLMNCYKGLQSLNPLIFNVIRIVQTVVGVALLFLLLTTLRVRFRLKITNN